jgi:signal transduction histidine kinase
MVAARNRDLEQAKRLERAMAVVRWFGVAFGLFQVWQPSGPKPPHAVTAHAYAIIAVLFLGNVAITVLTGRARRLESLRAIGYAAFALDLGVCLGLIWNYSFTWTDNTWVIGFILPLEGALRFQLRGAMFAAVLFGVSESLRELYLGATLPHYQPELSSATFHAGVGLIIGGVAGVMARSLAKEADRADDRAALAEQAAHREAAARREADLFHGAVLAGIASTDLEDSLQSMAEAIGRDLGFEVCAILLREEEQDVLRPVGIYGLPESAKNLRIGPPHGLTGTVAFTGRPLLVRDVRALTDYVEMDPRVSAEAAAPLRIGRDVIGVLDVETWGRFQTPEATLDLLTRLADQIALVVHSVRLQAQQQQTLERLSELDRMKSDFVAITSHELRTPLTAIRGFVKTMMRTADRLSPDDMQDFLQIVDRQAHRLARLVEDLLMASKIEAGQLAVVPEQVAPEIFLGNLMSSFGEGADRFKLRTTGEIPELMVLDPYRAEQIMRNLLHNATKFSPDGSPITLSVAFHKGTIELSVADNGIGIPFEEQARVFDRFHQASDSLTREKEGAGLGLYITKRLVEAMGGAISLQSEVGSGSTFTVRLPIGEPAERPAPQPVAAELR